MARSKPTDKWTYTVHTHMRNVVPLVWGLLRLAPSLTPSLTPKERPGTHCLHMHEIFHYIFRKKLHALPCLYAEDYTNQEYRAFFEIHSSDDLTYRTLLKYFSEVPVSLIFFLNVER